MTDYYKSFSMQRSMAKIRGISWDLPYWEWLQIWQESGHMEERGRNGGQWVMARNGDQGPYSAANVKITRVEVNNRDARRTQCSRIATRKHDPKNEMHINGLTKGVSPQ